jgi:hypothetical protein
MARIHTFIGIGSIVKDSTAGTVTVHGTLQNKGNTVLGTLTPPMLGAPLSSQQMPPGTDWTLTFSPTPFTGTWLLAVTAGGEGSAGAPVSLP